MDASSLLAFPRRIDISFIVYNFVETDKNATFIFMRKSLVINGLHGNVIRRASVDAETSATVVVEPQRLTHGTRFASCGHPRGNDDT